MSADTIEDGIRAHADLDRYLQLAREAAMKLESVTEAGVSAGMVKVLDGKELIQETRVLTGQIAQAARHAATLHIRGQKIAKANDLDTGALGSVGGVVVMGGGNRG